MKRSEANEKLKGTGYQIGRRFILTDEDGKDLGLSAYETVEECYKTLKRKFKFEKEQKRVRKGRSDLIERRVADRNKLPKRIKKRIKKKGRK